MSYEEWRSCAIELDELEDNNAWKQTLESTEYDPRLVQDRLRQLEDARISCDVSRMLFLVRTALSRDLAHMSNASLYRHSHIGTKDLIDRYITTALETIATLVDLSVHDRCDGLELKYILDNSQAKMLLTTEKYADKGMELLREGLEREPLFAIRNKLTEGASSGESVTLHDLKQPSSGGMMLYTSGTTNRPVGLVPSLHRRNYY